MNLLRSLYYRFNAWRYGSNYGCGRCHHGVNHHPAYGACKHCCCPEYSIERLS